MSESPASTLYDRILVPTDGSDEAKPVFKQAVDLAAVTGATIDALYVADARLAEVVPDGATDAVISALETEGTEATETIAEIAETYDVTVNPIVSEGIPHQAILQQAQENDSDIIIMGTHGRTGRERQLLGSVAERIVRQAPIPVVTVPLAEESTPTQDRAFR